MTATTDLIAEAREHADALMPGQPVKALVRRLADALEAVTAPTEADDREALISLIFSEGHELDMAGSRNLGYYRTEADCECGLTLWWGTHDGDPMFREVYGGHLADVALAAGFRRTPHPVQVTEAQVEAAREAILATGMLPAWWRASEQDIASDVARAALEAAAAVTPEGEKR